jgi:dihydrofolate reductase
MDINFIVAVSRNSCIGKDNDLPWRMKSDLKFFKDMTTNNAIIMGRKTFESMNSKPLPNRLNIVISKTLPPRVEGILVARDIDEALQVCEEHDFKTFIIGGGTLFAHHLHMVDTIYMTVVDTEVDGDIFFPELNYREWNQNIIQHGEADDKNQFNYTIHQLTRKN